jgi:uncharacterized Zn-finger protein
MNVNQFQKFSQVAYNYYDQNRNNLSLEESQPSPTFSTSSSNISSEEIGQIGQKRSGWKYSCLHCHKLFERPSTLKTHMNSHTGERPFGCPNNGCGRSFSVRSNMMRHHKKCRHN